MTQHYLLPCSCGQKVRVATAQAGGTVTCVCGKSLAVPTLRGLRDLKPVSSETAGKKALGWSRAHGVIFAAALFIASVGVAITAYHLWRYAQLAGSGLAVDQSSHVVEHEAERIDELSPEQTLEVWTEIRDQGLGEREPPYWVAAKEQIDQYTLWMTIGGGAIVAGVVIAVATLFVGRR